MQNSIDSSVPNFYQAPSATVGELASAPGTQVVKAERGTRLGAQLLDSLAALVAASPMLLGVALMDGGRDPGVASIALMALGGLALIALLVWQLMLLHQHGQTVGKRKLGIRIVRSNGERVGLGRILLMRGLLPGVIGAIPLLGPLFSLANILWIFGDEKRCLHDHIADTIVVCA